MVHFSCTWFADCNHIFVACWFLYWFNFFDLQLKVYLILEFFFYPHKILLPMLEFGKETSPFSLLYLLRAYLKWVILSLQTQREDRLYLQSLGSIICTQFKLVAPEELSAFLFLSFSLFFGQCNYFFSLGLLQAWKKINSCVAISILAYLKCRPDLPVHPAKIPFLGTVWTIPMAWGTYVHGHSRELGFSVLHCIDSILNLGFAAFISVLCYNSDKKRVFSPKRNYHRLTFILELRPFKCVSCCLPATLSICQLIVS